MWCPVPCVQMYPGSMKVGAQLGNLRFCNMRLGPHHQWGWFCDLRDPGSASLVKVRVPPSFSYLSYLSHLSSFPYFFLAGYPCVCHFQLEFCSYNPEDDDYEGYEYSLTGQLSAVRIVFLYRFISEVLFLRILSPTPSPNPESKYLGVKNSPENLFFGFLPPLFSSFFHSDSDSRSNFAICETYSN